MKPNFELTCLDSREPIKRVIEVIETIKNTDLQEDNLIIKLFSEVNDKLVIENFEKIVNYFKKDLSILVSIADGLKYALSGVENIAGKFPKTDDPVIKLLISYILNEEPDEGIIKKSMEIFRREKNEMNKKALFILLHHFLSPFRR